MFVCMNRFLVLFLSFGSMHLFAQKIDFIVNNISLPAEVSFYDNQFSGLYIHANKLFFLSESRLQDNAEAKLYSILLADIENKLKDTSSILPFTKIPILNLAVLRAKMKDNGDEYEGLEAMVIDKKNIYLSVETTTASNNCYLLKGVITDTAIILDEVKFIVLKKPLLKDCKHIYNAGFEAMVKMKKTLFAFFEYNYFLDSNIVDNINLRSFLGGKNKSFSIKKLPFRLTDITAVGKHNYTAINYFYNGSGEDEIYRVGSYDSINHKLIYDITGYKSYARLIFLKYRNKKFIWEPIWEFPKSLGIYNWEGLAAYKKGYFVMNDKYTSVKPYKSVLIYLRLTK